MSNLRHDVLECASSEGGKQSTPSAGRVGRLQLAMVEGSCMYSLIYLLFHLLLYDCTDMCPTVVVMKILQSFRKLALAIVFL